jgi:hypothetical protein
LNVSVKTRAEKTPQKLYGKMSAKNRRSDMYNRNVLYSFRLSAIFILFLIHQPLAAFERIGPLFFSDPAMNVQSETLLIDDFSESDGISSFGSQWRMFTDQVMGGVSTAEWNYDTIDGRKCVHLWGDVSLENNGGFVQIALTLMRDGQPLDASVYRGVRFWARGNGEAYHIHLRSSETRRPWQYYGAMFDADSSWGMYELPFSDFKPENLRTELKTDRLVRIAVVAIKKEFKADIAVARIEFYR